MTVNIPNTELTHSFQYLRLRLNDCAYTLSTLALTVDSNSAVGNVELIGDFRANTLYTDTLKGGNNSVNAEITVTSNLLVQGIKFKGNTSFQNDVIFSMNVDVINNLNVTNNAVLAQNTSVGKNLVVTQNTSTNNLLVTGSANVVGNLSVTGTFNIGGNIGFTDLNISNNLIVNTATISQINSSIVTVSNTTTNNLVVSNIANVSKLNVSGNNEVNAISNFYKIANFKSNTYFENPSSFTGNVTFSNVATFSNTVVFSGSLNTLSNTVINGNLTVNNGTLTTNSQNVTGNVSITGTITVSANAVLSSAANVAGVLTVSNTSSFSGNASFNQNISVTGLTTTATSNVTANSRVGGSLLVVNSASFSNVVTIAGLLTLSSGANVTGTVTATTFSGSGSQLTNIPAEQLTGNIANARLTGAYTGLANVTSNGTITAVTLSISGAATITGNISSSGNLSANVITGNGSGLTSLHGNNITTGVIPSGRLSGGYTSINAIGNLTTANSTFFYAPNAPTVGTPSYSWTGDSGTGLYHVENGTVGIYSLGSEIARFGNNGVFHVGIIDGTPPTDNFGIRIKKSFDGITDNLYGQKTDFILNEPTVKPSGAGIYWGYNKTISNKTSDLNANNVALNSIYYGFAANINNDGNANTDGGMGTVSGFIADIRNIASGPLSNTINNAFGFNALVRGFGVNTSRINNAYGVRAILAAGSNNEFATSYGVYSQVSGNNGVVNTGYAYYGLISGNVVNSYGMYITGETRNYLSGNLGIGNTTPSEKLVVVGNSIFAGSLVANQTASAITVGNSTITSVINSTSLSINTNGTGRINVGNSTVNTVVNSTSASINGATVLVNTSLLSTLASVTTGHNIVGSLGLMKIGAGTTLPIQPGGTIAGSNLFFSTAAGTSNATAASGTWRCLGYATAVNDVTLFMRIS